MATLAELWEPESKVKSFTDFPKSREVTDTHKGIDYAIPLNTPITAATSGIVKYKTNDPKGYGNAIEIVDDKGNVLQRYAHLNQFSAPEGSRIEPGQVLGLSGSTGKSTGPHLHFEDFTAKPINVSAKTQSKQTGETFADLWDKTPIAAPKNIKPEEKPKSFVEEVKKPFETFGIPEFQKESIIYNIAQLTNPLQAAEATKNLYEKSKNIVTGLGNLVENPKETLINAYKEITENPGKFLGQTIKGIIYDPETLLPIGGVAKVSKPVAQQIAERGSAGAAGVSNKSVLQAAIDIASPELKKDLTERFAKGDVALLNEKALNNVLEADQLPIPVRLTEGQATENPSLISRERNERGFKEQFVQRFNEQNKLLSENATAIKEKVSPNIHTTDYVADAQELIDAISKKKQSNVKATQDAYKELEKASNGKFPIDGKTFAENAINILNKEDRFDYLPSTIQKKLNDYATGTKEMNFNLFENLRTDLAAEIRKAQRAGDGNQAYVLGQVRNELENLPLKGEAANLKPLADKARSLAKADFELEANNLAYKNVVNQIADSKNFVEDLVIRSKNKDFANTLNLISDNPQALEHLRSGTLDYIINKSKDASGNFATGQFNKYINNLDVNKKLFPLFGEEAETIRNLARTGQRIEARPKGSFVNESNTATALGAMAKQYAGKVLEKVPGLNIAKEIVEERKAKKQITESLKPGAGTKLKDLGKK